MSETFGYRSKHFDAVLQVLQSVWVFANEQAAVFDPLLHLSGLGVLSVFEFLFELLANFLLLFLQHSA